MWLVLWDVCDEFDVGDDKLVLDQQVSEEDVFPRRWDGLRAEQADQRLGAGTLNTGRAGGVSRLIGETQRLQNAVLT